MFERVVLLPVTAFSLVAACGSDPSLTRGGSADMAGTAGTGSLGAGAAGMAGASGEADPALQSPTCVSGDNPACDPSGFPFVRAAFANSNSCGGICDPPSAAGTTIHFAQPETGTLCLSGTNPADDTGVDLVFTVLGMIDEATFHLKVLERFNADALGITQVRFTIANPPSGGILVWATTLNSDDCIGVGCLNWFQVPDRITESATTTVSFADFATSETAFDTRALDSIGFAAGPGDFDYCLSDFQFLDENGEPVPEP